MRLFRELDDDWVRLTHEAGPDDTLNEWACEDPAFRGHDGLRELVAYIRRPGHPSASDELLSSLVRRAPTDALAARAVLQALIPGLKVIAISRAYERDDDEVDAAVVACAWERIRRYPHARRPRSIAANIVRDTRKDVRRECPFASRRVDLADEQPDPSHGMCAGEEVTLLVREALQAGVIDGHEATLIARTRLGGETLRGVAASLGVSAEAVRKRCRRAEQRLGLVAR